VDHTYCYRCGNMMAAAFPVCPHCGAPQDEQSRAKGRRHNKVVFLTGIPSGLLGFLVGWLLGHDVEWGIIGGFIGAVAGVVIILPLYDKARKKENS
jgi:hypothetical protein